MLVTEVKNRLKKEEILLSSQGVYFENPLNQ